MVNLEDEVKTFAAFKESLIEEGYSNMTADRGMNQLNFPWSVSPRNPISFFCSRHDDLNGGKLCKIVNSQVKHYH